MRYAALGCCMAVLAGTLTALVARGAPIQEPVPAAAGAPQNPPAPRHIRMGSAIAAKLVYSVYPEYPKEAKKKHLEGDVRIRFVIEADGKVSCTDVVSGNRILAEATVEAVRQWRYQPTMVSGEPVAVQTEVVLHFHRHKWLVD